MASTADGSCRLQAPQQRWVIPAITFSQSSPIRLGLMTVKTGPLASGGIDMERALVQYLKETQQHARRPQGRAVRRRQRRRAGAGAHQDPGAGRARQDPRHDRAARRGRGARRRRLHPPGAAADAVGGGGRGHDAAQAQPLVHARHLDLVAVRACRWPTTAYKTLEDAAHGDDRRRHRLRPRDVRRLPARVRGAGRQDRAEDVPAADRARLRHLPRAAEDQRRRHLPRLRRLQRLPLPAPVQRVRPDEAR